MRQYLLLILGKIKSSGIVAVIKKRVSVS